LCANHIAHDWIAVLGREQPFREITRMPPGARSQVATAMQK
jgi:hypothetical protein